MTPILIKNPTAWIIVLATLPVVFTGVGILLNEFWFRKHKDKDLASCKTENRHLKKENKSLTEANGVYLARIKGAQMALNGGNYEGGENEK